jgi:hypothetical protein
VRGADCVTQGAAPRVMDGSTPPPIDDASALVQRIYALLLEAHATRQRLTVMHTDDRDVEAERVVYLGLVSAFRGWAAADAGGGDRDVADAEG